MTGLATAIPCYSVCGEPVDALPRCPGVYRFLGAGDVVLYVGKSIDIRARVRSHFCGAETTRQRRMLAATVRVDCRPTAGEAGALLLENAAIKREVPLYNRRQRSVRRLWSITLQEGPDGFLQPQPDCFSLDNPDIRAAYGSYASRFHARKALDKLARRAELCPRVLDLERGRGPCFQQQIGRCHGACVGEEPPVLHNARLLEALASRRLSAWPITAPVLLRELAQKPCPGQPKREWHLLHNWMYLGTYSSPARARRGERDPGFMFDRDTHRILRGILGRDDAQLFSLDTLAPVDWPGEAQPE